jgi:hypothetical protein
MLLYTKHGSTRVNGHEEIVIEAFCGRHNEEVFRLFKLELPGFTVLLDRPSLPHTRYR